MEKVSFEPGMTIDVQQCFRPFFLVSDLALLDRITYGSLENFDRCSDSGTGF